MAEAGRSGGTNPAPERKGRGQRTTIQVTPPTKEYLDTIKEETGADSYEKAILFLIRERRKKLPSSFGKLPTIGSFVREKEDPYRVPH
jgi:hypothetical protein